MRIFVGRAVSPGYAQGEAFVYRGVEALFAAAAGSPAAAPAVERARFERAVAAARQDLLSMSRRLEQDYGLPEAHILRAQLFMLGDAAFREAVVARIEGQGASAEKAVAEVVREWEERFQAQPDPYLRDRAMDVHDVGARVLRHLADRAHHPLARLPGEVVLVADYLLPSDAAFLDRRRVRAIVTARGSENSHAAILARALGIPAVTGVPDLVAVCQPGERVAVDGESGRVILQMEGPAGDEYERQARIYRAVAAELRQSPATPVATRDGVRVSILANVGAEEEAAAAAALGAEGIGLLRTEFLCLLEEGPPSEEQHEAAYRRVAAAVAGRVVTVRLLDLAPDKPFPLGDELALGDPPIAERGIHYLLRNPRLLRAQLRGVLRAADAGEFRVLLPMVTGVSEIDRVRELLAELEEEMREQGRPPGKPIPVGAMVETLPAVLMAPEIARAADFLSLGTNDLLGFLLGVRRDDTSEPIPEAAFEPSLFRAIDQVVRAASAAGKEVSVCGEIAGAPAFTKLLLGLGVRVLSMGPHRIAEVRYVVSETDMASARKLAEEVLSLRTAAEVRELVLAQVDPWQLLLRRRASEG